MKRLENHLIGIDQGSPVLFSEFKEGGPMWSETGAREVRFPVTFSKSFRSAPSVHVGISMWDMDQNTNLRADITAENITALEFDILFKTWGDTRIARIRASWMAIGEIEHQDNWDLY